MSLLTQVADKASAVPQFAPLGPGDSTVHRIEAVWNLPYSGPERRDGDRRLSTVEWLGEVEKRVSERRQRDDKAEREADRRDKARDDYVSDRKWEARERSSSCWHDQS